MRRMNVIREVRSRSMTVEAGVILHDAQEAAEKAGQMLPVSLGSEGSCSIGGILSTNAGGIRTLRYGNTRESVLGIEAVLPNGEIWNGLRRLRKDNRGYDLKQLFIGAEGTLGVITAATLKLVPRWRGRQAALCSISAPEAATALLDYCYHTIGEVVSACELLDEMGIYLARLAGAGPQWPLSTQEGYFVLLEFCTSGDDADLSHEIENTLAGALEAGLVTDAVLAASEKQRLDLWRWRHGIVEGQKLEGSAVKFDLSVPEDRIADFIGKARTIVDKLMPGGRPLNFGHIGDGNIHFSVFAPKGEKDILTAALHQSIIEEIEGLTLSLGGSFSAEHGVGRLRRQSLRDSISEAEYAMMLSVKKAVDPDNIMNPGVIFSE